MLYRRVANNAPVSESQRTAKPSKCRILTDAAVQSLPLGEGVFKDANILASLKTDEGKTSCFARHFDLLHKSNATVPLYADAFDLFVFGASLTSAILSKSFLTECYRRVHSNAPVNFIDSV